MLSTQNKISETAPESVYDLEQRWEAALGYFLSRRAVLFISYCRFWEAHGFVQQSLAQLLVEHGVRVHWLDGAGWRPYRATLAPNQDPRLTVSQLLSLPGRRFPVLERRAIAGMEKKVRATLKQLGPNPLLWVQGGTEAHLAERLPVIDVLSTFDDPYRAELNTLIERSKLVLCQNSFTRRLLTAKNFSPKFQLALPPIDLSARTFDESHYQLPAGFPKPVMGYIGSCFAADFDFVQFEDFMVSMPDKGFLLMGRTDEAGLEHIQRFKKQANFVYVPWLPRAQVASVWKQIDLSLLLYRPRATQDGAFPVKAVESAYFGVPSVGTNVPKTQDLANFFPLHSDPQRLKEAALEALTWSKQKVASHFAMLAEKTDPKRQLIRVAEYLQRLG